jgi:2-keto-4-pentenoate hydratase/2-oxohepta-3-ene-1,7-dioic acid hydratase in catechol pathway
MKLGAVSVGGARRIAVAASIDSAVVLDPAAMALPADLPADLPAVIEGGARALEAVRAAAAGGRAQPVAALHWLPPIARPGKLLCLALNNSANKDRIIRGPKHPATFTKPASSLIGHGQPIRMRPAYGRVHPEPELALVIGRKGRDIAEAAAHGYVFGYTIINDLTSPTMREEDTFHYRAIHPKADGAEGIEYRDTYVSYPGRYKGSDTFAPIGPWLSTRDEVPDPHDLIVRCLHQDRLITEDNTRNLFYKVPQVLAFVSHYMTLEPGDIISLGTALKSAGGGQAVQTVDLNRLGGPISVAISGLGVLSNPVIWD